MFSLDLYAILQYVPIIFHMTVYYMELPLYSA